MYIAPQSLKATEIPHNWVKRICSSSEVLCSLTTWPPPCAAGSNHLAEFKEHKVHLCRELHNLTSDSAPNSQTDVEQAGKLGHGWNNCSYWEWDSLTLGWPEPRPFSIHCSALCWVPRENCKKPVIRELTSPRKSERKLSFSLGLVSY